MESFGPKHPWPKSKCACHGCAAHRKTECAQPGGWLNFTDEQDRVIASFCPFCCIHLFAHINGDKALGCGIEVTKRPRKTRSDKGKKRK